MSTATQLREAASYYIARDTEDPRLIAVYRHTKGRHPREAGGFAERHQAERWISDRQRRAAQ